MDRMDAETWRLVSEHFHQIVDLPVEKQEIYLQKLMEEKEVIFHAVRRLLDEEKALHPALQTAAPTSWQMAEDEELVGSNIGVYELIEHLGSGGMGSVFLADRMQDDFEQRVALKLIRPGSLTDEAEQRFRRERQILAGLVHPGIARLYDGGSTDNGRLFFTMEHVAGNNIVDYLTQSGKDIKHTLTTFLQVAQAVSYAHSRLVLHLDIKPNNILMSDTAEVKVLDFGVAQKLDELERKGEESSSSPYTLAYGSPEQLLGKPVSTQSDIYSLGVLLYQLLSGKLPVQTSQKPLAEQKKTILQTRIQPPSENLDLPTAPFSSDKLSGDLDTIVMKCLERKPQDRYPSVDQLIADIQAHLEDRPISLRRENGLYNLSKFYRRNRAWLTTLIIAFIGLLGVGTFYTNQLREQRNEAIAEAQKKEKLLEFVTDIFEEATPAEAQGDTLTVYDLLDQANERIDSTIKKEPEVYIELLRTLSMTYMSMGELMKADTLMDIADSIFQDQKDLAGTLLHLKLLFSQSDLFYYKGDYETADSSARQSLKIARTLVEGQEQILPLLRQLGDLGLEQQKINQADSFYTLALDNYQQQGDGQDEDLAALFHASGMVKRELGEWDQSKFLFLSSLSMKEKLFEPPHSEIAYTLNNLASLYFDLADYDSALIYAKGGLAQRRVVFGPNHVETVASLGNVSRIYQLMKAYDSSLVYKIQMNQAMETILPPAHPYRIGGLCQIAALYLSKGEYKKAIEGYEKAVAMYKKLAEGQKKGRYPVQGRISYHGLAIGLFRIGEFGRAKEMVQRANELNESIEKPNERIRANMKVTLGRILIGQNDLAQGEKLLLEAKAYLAPLTGDARVDAYLDNIEAGLQEIKEKRNPSPEGEGA